MLNFENKRALVTGASGAIGRAIVKALHAQGATVAISGTRVEALESLAKELGDRCHIVPCKLSDPEAVAQLIPQAIEAMGGIDILINNAGITRDNLLMRMKPEERGDVLNINLEAPMALSQAALKPMMKNRWGRIINVCSVVGYTGNPGQTNYCASKAGLVGFSKALAQEVATRGITVNCIAPGFIESPMTDKLNEDQHKAILTKIPAQKMGTAQDIANACVFAASDESQYMTGQTLHINGGMAMY